MKPGYDLGRLPLLLVAVLLMLGAAGTWLATDDDPAAVALIAGALILVGAWTALEVIDAHRRMHERRDRGEGDDGERR